MEKVPHVGYYLLDLKFILAQIRIAEQNAAKRYDPATEYVSVWRWDSDQPADRQPVPPLWIAHRHQIDLKISASQSEYVQQASDQLKVTAARLGEIEQEQRKSDDAAMRQMVRAPAGGEVMDLKFTSPGAVIRPGDTIADIVPSDATLLLEARIRPEEVNHVQRDQAARIKFTAFKYRNTAMVRGTVSYVSADRLVDGPGQPPYYSVTIRADPASLREIEDLKLQAGMPAEVYIEGTRQTPLQYLAEPVATTLRRAARQM